MKRNQNSKKKFPVKYIAVALCAGALLVGVSTGYTKAEPNYTTPDYEADLETWRVGVLLWEGEDKLESAGLESADDVQDETGYQLTGLEGQAKPGVYYPELLSVSNNGALEEYVRVLLRIRWTDQSGSPVRDLDPSLIHLDLAEGWVVSQQESTDEKIVIYYTKPLGADPENPADGGDKVAFLNGITIDPAVASDVVWGKNDETGNITLTYRYNDVNFEISAEADAVQTGSAQDAILSAWGVEVNIAEDGTLSLPPTE